MSSLEIFARRHTEIDLPPCEYIIGLVDGGNLIKKMSWNDVRGFLEVVCTVFSTGNRSAEAIRLVLGGMFYGIDVIKNFGTRTGKFWGGSGIRFMRKY